MSTSRTALGLAPRGEASAGASRISPEDYQAFCRFLEESSGIVLGDSKQYLVSSRLGKVLQEEGFKEFSQLVGALTKGVNRRLRERVVDAMTTNETSWFRDNHPYQALKEHILPELASGRRTLRIWSAACSTGQEPYSIAITIHEFQQANPGRLAGWPQIVATDISTEVLVQAGKGIYDDLAMARGLTPERRRRYFRQVEEGWQVIPELRQRIQFRSLNLLESYGLLGRFDVIFCRNVLIYFSADSKRDILSRMVKSLNPGGYLIMGGSESISGLSDRLTMIRYGSGVLYRLGD